MRFRRPSRARARRRVPLMLSFAVLSMTLTLVLGIVLAAQVRTAVTRRDVAVLTKTTKGVIAVTIQTIVSQVTYGRKGLPTTPGQEQAQANAISAVARVLVANSDVVSVEAVLVTGLVIGGANAPAVGSKVVPDAGFRAALSGVIGTRALDARDRSATGVEKRLVRRYGELLLTEQGVRLHPGAPFVAVVRSYAWLGPTRAEASAEAWSINRVLAVGLLVFWLALFRLVWGASRALTRHSKANAYLATHDALTRLPNRSLLRDRTERAVLATRRSGLHVALILMDLNRFKEVNDTLGHPCGDLVLKQIGPRLREQLRDSDTVARIGGDEFVVMLPDLRSSATAFGIAEKLAAALQEPFVVDGVSVDVDSAAGLVTTPEHGDDFDELLQHADVAMYLAKHESTAVVAYAPELDSYSPDRLQLLADLRRAVEQPEHQAQIVLHYQPQADLADGRITGVEALVRWQHPTLGLISPSAFIPLAEHTGIIRPLTWHILRSALQQNRKWAESGIVLRVSVNISARCLHDKNFSDKVGRMLAETGVPAGRLELELTESVIMSDPDRALLILQDLAARGIRLSIDDFGTGYSSMAYLKRLPVHEIKIDQSFVTNMDTDLTDAAIVRSSLELARSLELGVVAEGVETREVWDMLAHMRCATAQGYFLSRPLPAPDFAVWMADHVVAELGIGRAG